MSTPDQTRYPGQIVYVVESDDYVNLLPFVMQPDGTTLLEDHYSKPESDARLQKGEAILKHKLNAEERDTLERFERDELRPTPDVEREIQVARLGARNTFLKTKRVNLRVTERDLNLAHSQAREEGIPYQNLAVQRHSQVPVRPTGRTKVAERTSRGAVRERLQH